nr:immunoglobulin light chain junction region [Macaca mulatta]MOX73344.1 immunoglobulin light chain junction region [Macaca mulatta]MOX77059.1 immunoglobulin light chain junction region [Macaca mulatta]
DYYCLLYMGNGLAFF